MKLAVLGDGGWGTTLALLLHAKKHEVVIWGAFPEYIAYLAEHRENRKFLPDIRIPDGITFTADIAEALSGADGVVIAVPAQFVRGVLKRLPAPLPARAFFVMASKGVENTTLMTMSQVVSEVLGPVPLAVLSGPSIALEVANGAPASVVASARDMRLCAQVQELFFGGALRVYTSDDLLGVELGGALKNIIAIAAGICEGLEFGSNSKSALMVRGIVEMSRLGVAMGARQQTFWGLSGIGDLITTCMSPYGRNRWFGEELGSGKTPEQVLKETEMVVEGYTTARSGYDLSRRYAVEMPIVEKVYEVLYEHKPPRQAVRELMSRDPKSE